MRLKKTIYNKMDTKKMKSRYYHQEMERFLDFLIPKDASVLRIYYRGGIKTKGEYDYILAPDLIGFSKNIQKTLQKLHKISYSKTRVILAYHSYFWEPLLKIAEFLKLKIRRPFQNWLSTADLENMLYLAGFEAVKKGERLLIPVYIPLLSWLANRYLSQMPFLRSFCLIRYFIVRPLPEYRAAKKKPNVSIVIAAQNEKGNIEAAVKRIPKLGSHTEIIFVEGGSCDGTWEEIKKVQKLYPNCDIKLFRQTGRGKGDAVRKGFQEAKGDILMILDADLTVKPEELSQFYQAIVSGRGEFINGCRLVYPLKNDSMRFLNVLANKFFGLLFSWLLGQRIKDTLCGTKVLWQEDYRKIAKNRKYFGEFDPFGDFDLLFGAAKLNLKIVDLPVRYQERTYGRTNISRFKHGWLLLKMSFFAMKKIKFI